MTLLTTDEYRSFVDTALGEEPLQLLLDAAEAEILRAAGDGTTQLFRGGSRLIVLNIKLDTITSITEFTGTGSELTLDPADYLVHPGGYVIERLWTGPHGRSYWHGRVTVTGTSVDDEALRKTVQLDLVRLAESYSPGLNAETVGAWTRQMSSNATWNADEERASILARLSDGPSMIVVGSI